MDRQNIPDIPLEQRTVEGNVISIEASVIHLALRDAPAGAQRARVHENHLPPWMLPDSLHAGDSLSIFLEHPTKEDPALWLADARWQRPEDNPWLKARPRKGEEVFGKAIRYVEDYGVIVHLKIGIDAFLDRKEIPGNPRQDITHAIHIGDRIGALIKETRPSLLEIRLSVTELLNQRRKQARSASPPFADKKLAVVNAIPQQSKANQTFQGQRLLIVDDDRRFADALQGWLVTLGAEVVQARNVQRVQQILSGQHPHAVFLDYDLGDVQVRREIHGLLKRQQGLHVLLISGYHEAAREVAEASSWSFLPKPLDYRSLIHWLTTYRIPATPHETTDEANFLWGHTAEERYALRQADRFLADLCQRFECQAALWVRENRAGVFTVLAAYGVAGEDLRRVETHLGQTLVSGVISHAVEEEIEVHRTGPLRGIAPQRSRHVRALPVEIGDGRSDALVLFRSDSFDDATQLMLRDQTDRVRDLADRLVLVHHMREVETFAAVGRAGMGLLHEIRGALDPIVQLGNDLRTAAGKGILDSDDQRKLVALIDQTRRVSKLASADLTNIQRERRTVLRIAPTVMRIVALMVPRANGQMVRLECGTLVDLTTSLPPQVLEQPLLNLLDNALYHCLHRDWARVRVDAELAPDDTETPIHIHVEDTGLGMTAEQRERLFTPRISCKGQQGIGMGLYVSRNLLRATGGDLVLEETIRWLGSRFCICLPMRLQAMQETGEPAP